MFNVQPSVLDPDLQRQLAGRCKHCSDSAEDGSDYCTKHHERQKGYQRQSMKKARAARRKARCCIDCGKKLARVRKRRGVRCRGCQEGQGDGARSRRVKDAARRVKKAPRGEVRTAAEGDGWNRSRYVGRDRRGAPSRADLDAEILRDAGYAKAEIEKFVRAFILASSPEVAALSAAQQKHARRLAADHAAYAARFLDDITDRLGGR